jgi:hypothetical protein
MFDSRWTRATACLLAAVALAGPLGAGQAVAASNRTSQDLLNKVDGGRLALSGDGTGEGATAITLRDPAWQYRTEVWDEVNGEWENGVWTMTFRDQAANKCLQPASSSPVRGTTIVVRTCDGTDLQRWVLRPEYDNNSRWWLWEPKVDTSLAMTLNRYNDGSWGSLYLNTAYPTDDRMWRLAANDGAW